MSDNILELKHITKLYPGVVALNDVSLEVRRGEVHALVGENGAGKSTLMKILSGTYTNYGGEVLIDGKTVHMNSEKDAFANGISIVAQELNYVAELSIAENMYIGREPKKGGMFIDDRRMVQDAKALFQRIGIRIVPDGFHIMHKSKYSGLYGDYSSFSEEYDELSDAEYDPEAEEESAESREESANEE